VERILSREEIAELLSAVHGGDLPAKTEEPSPSQAGERRITRLDLVSQQGPRHYKIENLDLTLDAFRPQFRHFPDQSPAAQRCGSPRRHRGA
jgi:flagellar motor switch protein FliM